MEEQFLDGDQDGDNQVKSIEDEQNEICRDRKLLVDAEDGGDSVNEDQVSVEFASDDEESDEAIGGVQTRKARLRNKDTDFEMLNDDDENSEEGAMDQLEIEVLSDDDDNKAAHAKAKKERNVTRRHRSDVDEAKLEDDEKCETVFIDNLPNDEHSIIQMLKECRTNIRALEEEFFAENDSEKEEEAERQLVRQEKGTGIKQFWCVPLSVDVRTFPWKKLMQS